MIFAEQMWRIFDSYSALLHTGEYLKALKARGSWAYSVIGPSSTNDLNSYDHTGGHVNNDQTSIFINHFSGCFFVVFILFAKFSAILPGSPPDKKFSAGQRTVLHRRPATPRTPGQAQSRRGESDHQPSTAQRTSRP